MATRAPGNDLSHRLHCVVSGSLRYVRGEHPEYVFTYRGHPLMVMNNSAWQRARKRVGLPQVRVNDLKHTFGCRLRAAGVGYEDRQDLLGHKSGRITTHYSAAELENLIEAANRMCGENSRTGVVKQRAVAEDVVTA